MTVETQQPPGGAAHSGCGRRWLGLCLALVFAAAFVPGHALWSEPYLRGVDAYYYAVQADSWHKTGSVRIPDSSVLHPIVGSLASMGMSAEEAVKLWTGLSLLLFAVAFYALCATRRFSPATTPLALWPVASPSVLFCAIEFPKTFSFCIVFVFGLAVMRFCGWRLAAGLTLAAFSCALHKMALAYVPAIAVGALCVRMPLPGGFTPFLRKKFWAGCAILMGAMALCLYMAPDSLHAADLLRLKAGRLAPGAAALFMEPNLPWSIRVELVAAVVVLACVCLRNRHGAKGAFLALTLAAPSFLPCFGAEAFSLGERFGLLLPTSVVLAAVLLLPLRNEEKTAAFAANNAARTWKTCAALALPFVFLSPFRLERAHAQALNPPYALYARMTEILDARNIPMLIVHKGMHYYYKYATGREAFSYEPEKHWPKQRVWRLVYGASFAELHAYLPPECGLASAEVEIFHGTAYSLVRDDCYVRFRAGVRRDYNPELHDLLWRSSYNPAEHRPAFLYRKHADDEKTEFSALP